MNNPCNQPCPYNTLRGCTILEHPGKYCPMGNMAKKENKPLTNGDRIRAMTDYELAEFMSGKIVDQRFLCDSENGNELSIGEQMAIRHNHFCAWNKWLKQPAKED